MNVIEMAKKKMSASEKKEKERAKRIYNNFSRIKREGGEVEIDPITADFLKKYGYEV